MANPYDNWTISTGTNGGNLLFTGVYVNPDVPIWQFNNGVSPVDLEVSTIAVNPQGSIVLAQNNVGDAASLIFQRDALDSNAPAGFLRMVDGLAIPTKPPGSGIQYITSLKTNATTYDDIALAGLQIYGNQTLGSPCIAYIDGVPNGDLRINIANGALAVSSLKVSTLFADTVVSTTSGSANSYTASVYMSTPILYADYVVAKDYVIAPAISTTTISTNTIQANNISTNYISTNDGYASSLTIRNANISTANISSMTAGNFGANRIDVTLLSSLTGDITFNLVSTLSLFGNVAVNPNINLGLGNTIQGLIGGAASQGLGVVLGGAALVTGAVGLITGRTSGGANPNVFQTINGTTQLQFSTLGSAVSSIFFDTNSPSPGVTPGVQTSTTIGIPAGAYCVRSVGDPLYLVNNVSSVQAFGEWIPVIQNNPTLPAFKTSTITTSSLTTNFAQISTAVIHTLSTNITILGQVTGNDQNTFFWGETGSQTQLMATSTIFPNATARTMRVTGDTFTTQVFGNSANFVVLNASNQVNGNLINASSYVSTPRLNTSTLSAIAGSVLQFTTSSINGSVYPPSLDTPSTLLASSITFNGNLLGTNSNAYVSFPASLGSAPYSSTIIGSAVGGILTNQVNTLFLSCMSTANIGQVNVTLVNAVSSLTRRAEISSLSVSSLTSRLGDVSSMVVSSLNGQIYPPPGFGIVLPSTVAISTLLLSGNFISNNQGAYSSWNTQGFPYPSTIIGGGTSGITTNQVICAVANMNEINAINVISVKQSMVLGDGLGGGNIYAVGNGSVQYFRNVFGSTFTGAIAVAAPLVSTTNLTAASSISFLSSLTTPGGALQIGGPDGTGVTAGLFNPGGGPLAFGRITSPYMVAYQNFTNLGATNLNGSLSVTGLVNATSPLGASFNGPITTPAPITGTLIQATANMTSPQITTQTMNVQQTANISTGVISSLFTNFVNGQPYPPQSGVTGSTPSTMLASTVFINGGLTLTNGGMAVTGGGVAITAGPLNLTGGGFLNAVGAGPSIINSVNISSMSSVSVTGNIFVSSLTNVSTINGVVYPPLVGTPTIPSTIFASTLFVNGGLNVTGIGPNNIASANISSLSSVSVTGNIFVSSLTSVSSINGAVYPPITFMIPSTLFTSTLFVNGGLNVGGIGPNFINSLSSICTITGRSGNFSTISSVSVTGNLLASTLFVNGGLTNTGIAPITTSTLQVASTILLSNALGSANINYGLGGLRFQSASDDVTIRSALTPNDMLNVEQLVGTTSTILTVGDAVTSYDKATTICGTYQTYYSGAPGFTPAGNVITSNVSSVNMFAANLVTSNINAGNIAALTLSGNLTSALITTSNINVSTINNAAYPPFSLTFLVPTGSITIWAGGQETTLSQNFNLPPGWLNCDGSLISTGTYSALASVIGTTYGATPPAGFTYLPDLTFAVPMGTPRKTFAPSTIAGPPTIQVTAYQSDSQYNYFPLIVSSIIPPPPPTIQVSSLTTWNIQSKVGGALNYGAYIPAGGVSIAGTPATQFPAMYVSTILQYDGGPADQGYILLRSCDGVSPIPKIPNTGPAFLIEATFQGVTDLAHVPPGVDTPYVYGTHNVFGNATTTRNQGAFEVGDHFHQGVPDTNSSAIPGTGFSVGNGGYTESPYYPFISTPTNRTINVAMPTAPNFLNLLYIIKH